MTIDNNYHEEIACKGEDCLLCQTFYKNPSYDTTLTPEKRLKDFLGAYFIGGNGDIAPSQDAKQEIIDFVVKNLLFEVRQDVIEERIKVSNIENPFYYNYLFSKKDLKRKTFRWWQYPLLWFIPMKVQITEDGVAYYKQWKGQYFFYGIEPLPEL